MLKFTGSDVVAIVSIVVAALSSGYAAWVSNEANIKVEVLRLKYKDEATLRDQQFTLKNNRCKSLVDTAASLAKAGAGTDIESISENERYIWAGIAQLPPLKQNYLLKHYIKGPDQSDEYGVIFTNQLTSLTLINLAEEAVLCQTEKI
ncbi:hypothetical protein M2404_003442 [Rheinheimera pacifica]|uniref:hypothetical protein n=1 Tax=Rheinheimera pacifica TaxID=173990 RepID=UPI0021687E63|nr:hypothetical protein [Rheinheimera pacifica]MCS4309079.1 hypothetical protein [Rheinheimera pacifica]